MEKGVSLKAMLAEPAIECLAHNLTLAYPGFDGPAFQADALAGLEPLSIMERGPHVARVLRRHLPPRYRDAVAVLLRSLTPPLSEVTQEGHSGFFYAPHTCFVAEYGLDPAHNDGEDPFEISLHALYELTRRFTAEFAIRPFLIRWPERTVEQLLAWTQDPDAHVRRLCSEGSRPRLPWGQQLTAFVKDPTPTLPILEALKDDPDLYVRRSVANHLGDILKDHPKVAFALCERWIEGATAERKWLIRHAVRLPAKKGNPTALRLRKKAKAEGTKAES
ncbi:DNA alkylation repair protein [Opitutus sp. ER46]|nr:DNA alkylation repair protein [Opitutus sp. ER46]